MSKRAAVPEPSEDPGTAAGGEEEIDPAYASRVYATHVFDSLLPFVPADQWFGGPESGTVLVKAFRAHKVSLNQEPPWPWVADLGRVRAVFDRLDLPYPDVYARFLPNPEGEVGQPRYGMLWGPSTGDGVLLLLITPLEVNGNRETEEAVDQRLDTARALLVAILRRNAAFEQVFEVEMHLPTRGASFVGPAYHDPRAFGRPDVSGDALELTLRVFGAIESPEGKDKNRIRLALRWYQRALQRPRHASDVHVEALVNYWVALEALAMPGTNVRPVDEMLAEMHGITYQDARGKFLLGRIQGCRSKIVHDGELPPIKRELLDSLSDVFVDVLVHRVGLPSGDRTRRYLDGGAWEIYRRSCAPDGTQG